MDSVAAALAQSAQVSPEEQARRRAVQASLARRRALKNLVSVVIIFATWPAAVMWAWNVIVPLTILTIPFSFKTYAAVLTLFVAVRVSVATRVSR